LEFSAGVKSVVESTVNDGALPCGAPSARSVSPSWAKASSRIASRRPVTLRVLAVVKSQAR
jgi:hypothetical protein